MNESEINIWPVGQAFADFVAAYLDIPEEQIYPYHGLKKKCNRRRDPGPFRKSFCKPVGEEWILVFDGSIATRYNGYFYVNVNGFLYSSDDYKCTDGTVPAKNKYYFTEIEYIKWPNSPFAWVVVNDGLNCKYTTISGNWIYIYRAYFNVVWHKGSHILWVWNAAQGSRGRVWKSKTGEFPGYYPVVQGHYEW